MRLTAIWIRGVGIGLVVAEIVAEINLEICPHMSTGVPVLGTQGRHKEWLDGHQHLVNIAQNSNTPLDVVLLGDSILQQWTGKGRWQPQHSRDENLRTGKRLFDKSQGATISGLALAQGGDKTSQTLWHIQNGIIPKSLQPKVWFLLIGTNDLRNHKMTPAIIACAIVDIALQVKRLRPNAKIIISGLLPKQDGSGRGSLTLGKNWDKIRNINSRLEGFCIDNPDGFYYFEDSALFVDDNHNEIKSKMMKDGIHPTPLGLELWGPKVVKKVQELIEPTTG